ncbi:hypothetical protein BBJ28_00001768 [Nothophytophthora sp. Chile5]|nr:hypothetical protein BBJ28_00001768 [Nothophytophthora sp. Chile5]
MDVSFIAPSQGCMRHRNALRERDCNPLGWPRGRHGDSFRSQESTDEEAEVYRANRRATVAMKGFVPQLRDAAANREENDEEMPDTKHEMSPVETSKPPKMQTKSKRIYKKRKATHTVRKEEKAALETELKVLQAKLEALKFQALVQRGEATQSLRKRVTHNIVLREVIQSQHLVVAKTQALLSGYTQQHIHATRPMQMDIRLSADRAERRQTLYELRDPKLRDARKFMHERSHSLDPTAEYFQEERYETSEGDYCVVRFDRTPLRGVSGGVRAVFDAMLQAAFNAEIIISETSGNITIREDDDLGDENLSQMRLVTETTRGVLVENNLVHFSDYSHAGGCDGKGGSYALTVTDFVDDDALYPYRPHERVRRDVTSVVVVTSCMEASPKQETEANSYGGHTSSEEEGELVVVVTRWSCARICHTELAIPHQALRDLRDMSSNVAGTIMNCVRETVGLPVRP